ncbi:hypothetical protein FB451DRAFT_1491404 [Mycena latifolia]|nr:hypothetical protein FB451DRAFT_1491404 [Mycena latifolia]
MANRISYALDLTGPSMYLDTACSSSLTALHIAIAAIQSGDCAAALVGAAQINRDPFEWTTYMQGGVLSPDGMCRPLDAAAGGFGRGEGAVVVVLKPLADAIRDHDHIYSVVLGSAINATGSRLPLYVPNGVAQQHCIHEVYRKCNLNPTDADYIELHATGTFVGDPIEANAAGPIFATDRPALVGSVKGNIGHLEAVAFLASLVKACLMFEHKIIPPAVNFSKAADTIDWDAFKLVVPVEPTPLGCRSASGRSIISISGFGLGGATGHVVLQAPPPPKQPIAESSTAPILFIIGGLSSNAVDQISQGVLEMASLAEALHHPPSPHQVIPPAVLIPNEILPLAFVFSGQGPQHLDMGRQLFAEYPVFRNTVIELDDVFRRIRGVSLIKSTGLFALAGSHSSAPTITLSDGGWPVVITACAIAMVQMAMFDLLKSLGIVPYLVLGHSAGETAALYASGAGPKEMAMEIAIARGEAMALTESAEVGMAVMGCNAQQASELIGVITANDAGVLELSCFNAPDSVAVSGSATLLDAIVALAKQEGILAQRIRTMTPGHSSLMDCIKEDYLARMNDIFIRYPGIHSPTIPVHSTCREEQFVDVFTADYFWDNCRLPVLFSKAISHSLPSSPIFLEISCHPVLSSSILAHGVPDTRVLCPMRRVSAKKQPTTTATEPEFFLNTIGHLSLLGINSLDLSGLYGQSTFKSKLIEHPLAVRTIPPPKSLSPRLRHSAEHNTGPLSSSNLRINKTTHPDLAEHVINGEPILPATAFIELARANFLWDIEFLAIISLTSHSPLEVSLRRLDAAWIITTTTASREREHARGFMDSSTPNEPPPAMDYESIFNRLPVLPVDGLYTSFEPLATFGPRFQRVLRCHGGQSEAIAEIAGPNPDELADGYLLHPAVMDACIHVILHASISKRYSKDNIYLPSKVEHFIFYRRKCGATNWFSHITLRRWMPDSRYYDVLITDSSGLALCELRNLMVHKFTPAANTVNRRFDLIFQPVALNTGIPILPASFLSPADKDEIQALYETLDSLAVAMLSKSLDNDIVLGKDESRRRYLNFARQALKKRERTDISPQVLRKLKENWPHHFEITSRIGAIHESVFDSPKHAVNTLWTDDLMAKYYSRRSQTSSVCSEATKAFSEILDSLVESGKRSIRILEVGAGGGHLTQYLIDELKQNPALLVEYTVTDISYAMVAELARNIEITSGSVVPKAYDISKDPNVQGLHSESYDAVVALNVLHAAPIIKACLTSLHNLLVPGGCLLAVELDGTSWVDNPGSVWLDCIFGSFPEWFGYDDERNHCAMSPTGWKEQLEAVDFVNFQPCVESGGSGREFFFIAQKSLSYSPHPSAHGIDPHRIYSYEFGQEIELQRRLSQLDTTVAVTFYLLAVQGRDADAAMGLCVALRRDMPLWDIRLAIFETSRDLSNPTPLLIRHVRTFGSGENVLSFDRDGAAHVARVALSLPPSSTWQHGATQAVSDDPNHISLRIIHWAGVTGSYDGFVGQVAESHRPDMSPGDFFGGVVEASSANLLRVHINHIIPTTKYPDGDLAAQLLGNVIASLITWPSVGSKARMAVAIKNESLSQLIARHAFNISGIQLVAVDFRDRHISERLDILITESTTYAQHRHLRRWIPRSGQIFLWDELLKDAIYDDPSYIRRTLANVCETPSVIPLPLAAPSVHDISVELPRASASPPFRSDRVYLLLGGIGGLGIDLAVWLYRHGARHLVLTSRRGPESLDPIRDAMTLAQIAYLKSLDDLNLQLEKCDGTDVDEMNALLHSFPAPIAGCFHMTMVLSDALFFKQTHESFQDVYKSKIGVFEVFAAQVEIRSLDFFVAFSSMSGLVGIPGQSNYASACTVLDGLLAGYPNAFSFIAPGISDAGYVERTGAQYMKDVSSNITAEGLWTFLKDALCQLDYCTFNQYIPDLDWPSVDLDFTLPVSCRHLASPTFEHRDHKAPQHREEDILAQVLELLEVSLADFDAGQPLISYGLDSINAGRLSTILRPYTSFSPLRLLGGATWSEIEIQLQQSAQTDTENDPASLAVQISSESTMPSPIAQPLVEICSGSGVPLIILPGSNGSAALFFGLRKHFHGALWAIQITESTPLESLAALAGFWKEQICAKRPHGPYRFAAYSASNLLGVALTKMMEDAGEEVVQLAFIDHCPAIWSHEEYEAQFREMTAVQFLAAIDQSIFDLLRDDPTTGAEGLASYQAALRGAPEAEPGSLVEIKVTSAVQTLVINFLQQFYPADTEKSYAAFIAPFNAWLSSVKAPLAVLVAEHGTVHTIPGETWFDLGASRFEKPVEVHYIGGVGHYGIFRDERVAQILDQ